MTIYNNIKIVTKYALAVSLLVGVNSCTIEEQIDPNRPSLEGVLTDASINQLNNLVVGVQAAMRNGIGIQTTGSGSMARELYIFDADPRNTANLLGKNGSTLENGDFYATAPWNGRYRAIKNANILIEAVNNTNSVTAEQRAGYVGFAQTMIAYELIQLLKSYNRARIDVADELNLGPVLEFSAALTEVRNLLDSALGNLNNAGSSFAYDLAGFSGFDTPATFTEFNRAVAAVAALYDGDNMGALNALNDSFFDINGDISVGPQHVFSQLNGDVVNPIFKGPSTVAEPNNGDQLVVHNSWINDAEPGDIRVSNKAALRPDPSVQDGLTGTHETRLYASNVSPISLVRNEELILVYAEANIGVNNGEAVVALNKIRMEAGLGNYMGMTTDAALVTEMLHQRRYSLWCENHRMFDLRRYNLSNTLPLDRAGDVVYNQLPIPFAENE